MMSSTRAILSWLQMQSKSRPDPKDREPAGARSLGRSHGRTTGRSGAGAIPAGDAVVRLTQFKGFGALDAGPGGGHDRISAVPVRGEYGPLPATC